MASNSSKLLAVCSVCFHTHFLSGAKGSLKPIRHGFRVHGGHGKGHQGSWHGGPCPGTGFPHFGHSTEGTKWALHHVRKAIEGVKDAIKALEARPDLNWSFRPNTYSRDLYKYVPDAAVEVVRVLKPGTEMERATYRQSGITYDQTVAVPSYEQELNTRMSLAKTHLNGLMGERDMYKTAIETWKPAEPTPAPAKVATVHLAIERNFSYNKETPKLMMAPKCKWRLRSYEIAGYKTSTNPAEVTCQRCKK